MRLKVHLAPVGAGLTPDDTLDLFCGDGEQILQWIGYAACSRLAYKRGEVYGRYIPQSVTNKDGQALDIDIVVNELFQDHDEVIVEYSSGPVPFSVRWEGRPRTPPFRWDIDHEVLPPHDTWLTELDLKGVGLGQLVELQPADPLTALDKDLERVKDLLRQYAGALQMVFLLQSSDGATSGDQLGHITLPQFRAVMNSAKVINSKFSAERVDEVCTSVATSNTTLARKVESKSGVSTFDLLDFLIAIVHVAYHRFAAINSEQYGPASLHTKLAILVKDCFCAHLFPDLQRKLDKFSGAYTPGSELLLKRARRLIEQTLDSCQLKRVRSSVVKVDLRWLCNHLQKWNLLGREFNFNELALMAIFAKQPVRSSLDPERFQLHPQPLEYDYNEFERLLLAIAYQMFLMKKKADQQSFEQVLGETLDTIFKKANVLLEVQKDEKDGED